MNIFYATKYVRESDIICRISCPRTLEQNGKQHIIEMGLTLLYGVAMPK